jgi:hypothetical protein
MLRDASMHLEPPREGIVETLGIDILLCTAIALGFIEWLRPDRSEPQREIFRSAHRETSVELTPSTAQMLLPHSRRNITCSCYAAEEAQSSSAGRHPPENGDHGACERSGLPTCRSRGRNWWCGTLAKTQPCSMSSRSRWTSPGASDHDAW